MLTIWIAASQIDLPITGAVTRAASEILGPSITVQTAAFPDASPDSIRPPVDGERSVRIAWESPGFGGAQLTLCRAARDCFERSVSFRPDDPELERGRTVGFLATAVFIESAPRQPSPAEPEQRAAAAPPAESKPPTRKGSVAAAATLAAPGTGTSVGARLDADYALLGAVRVGVGVEGRFGEVSAAQATSRILSGGLTLGWVATRPSRALWLGVQLGLGVYHLSLSHLSSDDPAPDRKGRALFGGDLTAKVALDINEFSSLYLEPGVEVLSGRTDIVVHEQIVATWPVAIPILRLGLRAALGAPGKIHE